VSEPYLSEIRLVSFSYPPRGWAFCNGQLMPINQNQALFALLGTTYGGDGRVTFALPDLRGRTPIHMGAGFTLGQQGGEAGHTLTIGELPQHFHTVSATTAAATTGIPGNGVMLATSTGANGYQSPQNLVAMDPSASSMVGGSQAHNNQQPLLVLAFCIALQGIFPSRN
jgi:microcystin-dependent protein